MCLSLRVGDIVAFDQGGQRGRTALIWAATEGKADCVRLLLNAGADKEATDEVRVDRPLSLFQACFGLGYLFDGNNATYFVDAAVHGYSHRKDARRCIRPWVAVASNAHGCCWLPAPT